MKLAFCGLGLIGSAMVQRLLSAGHQVNVWNRTPAKATALVELGAVWCDSPAQAATGVDGALLSLHDAHSVEAVAFGAGSLHQARHLPWIADHSSISPDATRRISERMARESGAVWLDAPVSGGLIGVQTGKLTVMVGGDTVALPAFKAAVQAYASRVSHMGVSGSGQVTKLCNQVIVSTAVAAIAEAVGLAERNGMDPARLTQALAGGWADSKPLQVYVPRMAQPQPDSIGALSSMLKDVDNALAVAQSCRAPLPLTACVQQQLRTASVTGLGESDLSALIGLYDSAKREAFLQTARVN